MRYRGGVDSHSVTSAAETRTTPVSGVGPAHNTLPRGPIAWPLRAKKLWTTPVRTAEGEGFEPPGTCIPRLFKSLAFGRSAIPPLFAEPTHPPAGTGPAN